MAAEAVGRRLAGARTRVEADQIRAEAADVYQAFWAKWAGFRSDPSRLFSYERTVGKTGVWEAAARHSNLQTGERVIDLGAGSAQMAGAFNRINVVPGLYVAVDFDGSSMDWGELRLKSLGWEDRGRFVTGDLREPKTYKSVLAALGNYRADSVVSAFGIVNHAPAELTEIARLTKEVVEPRGRLTVLALDGKPNPKQMGLDYVKTGLDLLRRDPLVGIGFFASMPGTAFFGIKFGELFPGYTCQEVATHVEAGGWQLEGAIQPALMGHAGTMRFRQV